MAKLLLVISYLIICMGTVMAQQGSADPDYYPVGYSGKTWTGAVTAFDNKQRTLTLTSEDKKLTFVASIPDAPYERRRDAQNFRMIDFPYDKDANIKCFNTSVQVMPALYSREVTAVLDSSVERTPKALALET